MYKHKLIGRAFLFGIVLHVLVIGITPTAVSAGNETEILQITQGKPVKLGPYGYVNDATLGVSQTGVIAVGVGSPSWPGWKGGHWMTYRVSNDGGETWTEPMQGHVAVRAGTGAWATLRGGGAIQVGGLKRTLGEGWWETILSRFSDDMMHYQMETIQVGVPQAGLVRADSTYRVYPSHGTGTIIQLPNGDLLSPMQGKFKGDEGRRAFLTRSVDRGRTWRYHATMAYEPKDPNPELPGHYLGPCEPSVALLANGQLLCMIRMQYSHLPNEYRPLYVCWSDDLGKTWSKPVPTNPHLMNIHPILLVMDNGVVACIYGRPGFHVAFSLDNGHTWQDRISFSHLPVEKITGQVYGNKIGPNKLMAIGGVGPGGTQVFSVTVDRVKVSPDHVPLTGQVLNEKGSPIADAKVERGPNRYTADDWLADPTTLDAWGHGTPVTVGSPELGYKSIQKRHGYSTVQTDAEGRFHFESVKLGEYVLTVEGDGYAPQHKHVKVGLEAESHDFRLKAGRKICNRVVDDTGGAVPGACVVFNNWHVHTDLEGFFHWSVEAPLPKQVEMQVYKRYSGQYETLKTTVSFSQLMHQPIVLKRN